MKTTFPVEIAVEEIVKEMDTIIADEVHKLYADLIQVGRDVWDTGAFFRGFSVPEQVSKYHWRIRNTADHAIVLAQGRYTIGGRAYGSLKWQHGLDPMLRKMKANIVNRFDEVKR